MERTTGGTLEDFILRTPAEQRGAFSVDETRLRVAVQIADALQHLHKRQVVHRDVKPANIFLSARLLENKSVAAKLGDFGIVKWGDFHSSVSTGNLTATMQKGLGTMKYMSPEQALSPKTVTVRADVFSLGITLFELFTAQVLQSFHHVFEVMIARDTRGTTASRAATLGLKLDSRDSGLLELILEMHRRGASGRPTMDKVRGNLIWELEQRYGFEWMPPRV